MEEFLIKLKELQRITTHNSSSHELAMYPVLDDRDTKSLSVSSALIGDILSYYFKVKVFKKTNYMDSYGNLEFGKESVLCVLGMNDDAAAFATAYKLAVAYFEVFKKKNKSTFGSRGTLYHFMTVIEGSLLEELFGNVSLPDSDVLDAYDKLFPVIVKGGAIFYYRRRSRMDYIQLGVRWNYKRSEVLQKLELQHLRYSARYPWKEV